MVYSGINGTCSFLVGYRYRWVVVVFAGGGVFAAGVERRAALVPVLRNLGFVAAFRTERGYF